MGWLLVVPSKAACDGADDLLCANLACVRTDGIVW
jgi:hypothetical protein